MKDGNVEKRTKDSIYFSHKGIADLNGALRDGDAVLREKSSEKVWISRYKEPTLKSSGRSPGAGWL